jgi:hypothetical protein
VGREGIIGRSGFSGRAGRDFLSLELSKADADSLSEGSFVLLEPSNALEVSEWGEGGAWLEEDAFKASSADSSAAFTIFENLSGSTCKPRNTNAIASIHLP